MRSAFYLLSVCLFASCSSINYVGIDTYNPAEVTFPEKVSKVLVVNNAVPQPSDVGYIYNLMGVGQDTCRAKADSALFDVCRGLGKAIVDVSFFDDVLLYDTNTRHDAGYYTDQKLTPEQVTSLCDETGADAVISVDRMLFDMKKDVVALAEGYLIGTIDMHISGVIRSYLPGRPNPLATVLMSDSIFWSESIGNMVLLNQFLPSPDGALRTAGAYIGAKASPNFVPHWENESRWFFTGIGSAWKEATAYAQTEKWEQAADRWKHLFRTASGWKSRAKAASNIALSYEMKSDLKEAYDWASKSYDLFKKNDNENSKNTKLLQLYMEALAGRIRSDRKLNMQFGEQ